MDFKYYYASKLNESAKVGIRIGVVGYSDKKFDKEVARGLIKKAFDKIAEDKDASEFTVVSGWTNLGIPALAYEEAKKRGWKTKGIACKKAQDFELFKVDEGVLIGDEWGDESATFLEGLGVLVRIGGGKQSKAETAKAKEMKIKVIEMDLEEEK
jgi:hypothetical protein